MTAVEEYNKRQNALRRESGVPQVNMTACGTRYVGRLSSCHLLPVSAARVREQFEDRCSPVNRRQAHVTITSFHSASILAVQLVSPSMTSRYQGREIRQVGQSIQQELVLGIHGKPAGLVTGVVLDNPKHGIVVGPQALNNPRKIAA